MHKNSMHHFALATQCHERRACDTGRCRTNPACHILNNPNVSSALESCWGRTGTGIGEQAEECDRLRREPPAHLQPHDDQLAAAGRQDLRVGFLALPPSRVGSGRSWIAICPRSSRAVPRDGAHERGIHGDLCSLVEGEAVGQYLDAAGVRQRYIKLHVAEEDIVGHPGARFAAHSRGRPLQGRAARAQHACCGAGRAVVTPDVESPTATAGRGAWGKGARRRRSSRMRMHSLGKRNSGAVGSAVTARGPPGPA